VRLHQTFPSEFCVERSSWSRARTWLQLNMCKRFDFGAPPSTDDGTQGFCLKGTTSPVNGERPLPCRRMRGTEVSSPVVCSWGIVSWDRVSFQDTYVCILEDLRFPASLRSCCFLLVFAGRSGALSDGDASSGRGGRHVPEEPGQNSRGAAGRRRCGRPAGVAGFIPEGVSLPFAVELGQPPSYSSPLFPEVGLFSL